MPDVYGAWYAYYPGPVHDLAWARGVPAGDRADTQAPGTIDSDRPSLQRLHKPQG